MLYSPQDSDFTESQSLQNKTAFVLLYCSSHISHNLKRKDSIVRWHLCFSSLSPRIPSPSKGLKESGLIWRGGHLLPAMDVPSPPPHPSSNQTVDILHRGLWGRLCQAGSIPSLKQLLNILKTKTIPILALKRHLTVDHTTQIPASLSEKCKDFFGSLGTIH